uniref:Uncharacterized protein n=1 Tax=Haptolina ericina TaxID=156174 RepID=A0A7S3AM44_9EUKA|mmetsp:Transcript_22053/g.49777  ORF Transcript_22053/g.49777 Transcript_22053/m.49777 type:complete len:141 (+) Transcript_22053:462-884(+)
MGLAEEERGQAVEGKARAAEGMGPEGAAMGAAEEEKGKAAAVMGLAEVERGQALNSTQRRLRVSLDTSAARISTYQTPAGVRAILVQTDEPLCSLHVAIATEADTNAWSHKHLPLVSWLTAAAAMGAAAEEKGGEEKTLG